MSIHTEYCGTKLNFSSSWISTNHYKRNINRQTTALHGLLPAVPCNKLKWATRTNIQEIPHKFMFISVFQYEEMTLIETWLGYRIICISFTTHKFSSSFLTITARHCLSRTSCDRRSSSFVEPTVRCSQWDEQNNTVRERVSSKRQWNQNGVSKSFKITRRSSGSIYPSQRGAIWFCFRQ